MYQTIWPMYTSFTKQHPGSVCFVYQGTYVPEDGFWYNFYWTLFLVHGFQGTIFGTFGSGPFSGTLFLWHYFWYMVSGERHGHKPNTDTDSHIDTSISISHAPFSLWSNMLTNADNVNPDLQVFVRVQYYMLNNYLRV